MKKQRDKYGVIARLVFSVGAGLMLVWYALYNLPQVFTFIGSVVKILTPVTIGLVIAYLLNPIAEMILGFMLELLSHTRLNIKNRQKVAKGLSITLSVLLLMLIVIILLAMVIPQVKDSIYQIVNKFSDYQNGLRVYIGDKFAENPELQATVLRYVDDAFSSISGWIKNDLMGEWNTLITKVSSSVVGTFKAVINIVLGLCVAVYVLISKHRFVGQIKKVLYGLMKKENVNVLLAVARETDSIFGGFISGKLIDSLIIGILCFIGCSIMKMPYTALVSVIIGVTNIVPLFGPWIGAIPCSLIILMSDHSKLLIFVIFIVALQQFDGNILGPNILGDSTGLSAFWVVVAITLGGGLFGIVGMIIGVPTFAVIYFLIKNIIEFKLREKNMPEETISYTKLKRIDPITQNAEFINGGVSKRERRKQNIFKDDVTREINVAVKMARMNKNKEKLAEEEVLRGNAEEDN